MFRRGKKKSESVFVLSSVYSLFSFQGRRNAMLLLNNYNTLDQKTLSIPSKFDIFLIVA